MSKEAILAHTIDWLSGPTNNTTPIGNPAKNLIKVQIGGLLDFAKQQGLTFNEFTEVTSEALREEIATPARDGFATAEEGLTDLLNDEGGCVDVNAATKLYRKPKPVTRQHVGDLIREDRLIAYRASDAGEYNVPVWQFKPGGGVWNGLPAALAELKKSDTFEPITPFLFFLQENVLLGGETPRQFIRSGGDIEKLVFAASAFAKA